MDSISNIIAIIGILALVFLYKKWSTKTESPKNLVPEIPGGLPIIGHLHLLGEKQILPRTFGEFADKYRGIFSVRLGAHRAVILNDYESMKQTFTANDINFSTRPPSSQAKVMGYNYAAFGFAPYGPYWRNVRKLVMIELLSSHRVKSLWHVLESEVNSLIRDLNHGPAKVQINICLEHLFMNIITRLIAGKRYFEGVNDSNDEHRRPIAETIREFMYASGTLVPADFVPILRWFDITGIFRTMKRVAKEFDALMDSWIDEHKTRRIRGNTETNPDFIDVMLSVTEDDSTVGHKSDVIIKATAMSLIVAGSDTTAITMTWLLSNLLNNRRVMQLVQQELDEKVGRDRWVKESDFEKLLYLQAVIKESLRLYPPAPFAVPRMAAEDCYVGDYFVAKGTHLFTNVWKVHRDPKMWEDPEAFKPERFLTSKSHLEVIGQNYEYAPFGAGRRSCPGYNFAMQLMNLAVAKFLQAFTFETPNNEAVDMSEGFGITLPKTTPLEVILTPRLPPELYQQLN